MTLLSVNVNKIATLRNSRGKNNPDVLKVALDCVKFGAHGITVHPRPDARHIRFSDVRELKKHLNVELNVEGYPSEEFLKLIEDVRPAQTTLVPDAPDAITSNAGWNVVRELEFLKVTVERLHKTGCRVSLFIDPKDFDEEKTLAALKETKTDRIELYTEAYAENFAGPNQDKVLAEYKKVAQICNEAGIAINAGHDLNLDNLSTLLTEIGIIKEVSIGHALICDALYMGLETTIKKYLQQLPS